MSKLVKYLARIKKFMDLVNIVLQQLDEFKLNKVK